MRLGEAELPEHVLHATSWDFYGSCPSPARTSTACPRTTARASPAHCDIALIISPHISGVQWYRSMNGYYLTRGANGVLAPHCIVAVRILASGEEVFGSAKHEPPAAEAVMRSAAKRAYMGVASQYCFPRTAFSTRRTTAKDPRDSLSSRDGVNFFSSEQ